MLSVFLDSVVERTPDRTVGGSLFLPPQFSLSQLHYIFPSSFEVRVSNNSSFWAIFFSGQLVARVHRPSPIFWGRIDDWLLRQNCGEKEREKTRDNLSEDISDSHVRT